MYKRDKEEAEYLKKLGGRIKTIRKEKCIKQVDLAYSCDIEKQSMSRIEAGNTNPSVLLLRKIAELLGMEVKELLDF
jgi:DNA-binding XRE family transcriptional regulator